MCSCRLRVYRKLSISKIKVEFKTAGLSHCRSVLIFMFLIKFFKNIINCWKMSKNVQHYYNLQFIFLIICFNISCRFSEFGTAINSFCGNFTRLRNSEQTRQLKFSSHNLNNTDLSGKIDSHLVFGFQKWKATFSLLQYNFLKTF